MEKLGRRGINPAAIPSRSPLPDNSLGAVEMGAEGALDHLSELFLEAARQPALELQARLVEDVVDTVPRHIPGHDGQGFAQGGDGGRGDR